MTQRCGFVAIVGRPNVGKSTLVNHLLRFKLAITSRKPQTTRYNMLGIDTREESQAIYVDTPGIHDHLKRSINRQMVKAATSVLSDVDAVIAVFDRDRWTAGDDVVLEHLKGFDGTTIAVLNKVDLLADKTALLPAMASMAERFSFDEIVPVSALKGDGLDALRDVVFDALPEGPHMFEADAVTDRSERFLVAEIVREKLMRRLGDELPHRTAVAIARFNTKEDLTEIYADVLVERQSQKRIVIGANGAMLKSIGTAARHDIERLLGTRVALHLWVKVRAGWTDDEATFDRLGEQ